MQMNLDERIELTRQSLRTFEAIRNNGGNIPDGFVLEFYNTDDWFVSSGVDRAVETSDPYRLRRIEPVRVPLEPNDIPPFSVVRQPNWMVDSWAFVSCVTENSPEVYISASTRISRSLDQLMSEGWLIKRPSDTEWQPCSKVSGAQ